MKKLLIGLLVIGSISSFAQEPTCEDKAVHEILLSKTVKSRLELLLSNVNYVSNGTLRVDSTMYDEILKIRERARLLAELACGGL